MGCKLTEETGELFFFHGSYFRERWLISTEIIGREIVEQFPFLSLNHDETLSFWGHYGRRHRVQPQRHDSPLEIF